MSKLLSFEFYKRWRSYRAVLIGILALLVILIPLTAFFYYKKLDYPMGVTLILYLFTISALMIFPPIESLVRFNRDISGSVSVLELSLPLPAWEKVLSKLIATICTLFVSLFICIFSALVLIKALDGANFNMFFSKFLSQISSKPLDVIFAILIYFLNIFCIISIIFLCVAASKSITHKNKIAVPLSIGLAIVCIVAYTLASWFSTFFPIVTFQIYSNAEQLSSILVEIVFIVASFFATSWLVDKKIES
jgi:hypothetical protein